MASTPLRDLFILVLASSLISVGSSKSISNANRNEQQLPRKRAALNILKTTITDSHTIDWVSLDSQGPIAEAPPPREPRDETRPLAELELPGAELGPPGTVPIPRASSASLANGRSKKLPGMPNMKRQESHQGDHWYVSSNQTVANLGGSCVFSLFAPYTQNTSDSSLLQTAVVKQDVLLTAFRGPPMNVPQTVEAGWINFIDQVPKPVCYLHPRNIYVKLELTDFQASVYFLYYQRISTRRRQPRWMEHRTCRCKHTLRP
jgi:hypothetical protein